MDAFFTGLTKRQAMLLLTAVTFGGQDGVETFDHLPDDEAEVLRDRASKILAIPRDKRVPFLVQEIKRFVTGRTADLFRAAAPERVAAALSHERPALVDVVLRALPAGVANEVRSRLGIRERRGTREVRPDVLAVLRWKFEDALADSLPSNPAFGVGDLLTLPSRELFCLAEFLGARSLAPHLAALPGEERDSTLKRLPPELRPVAGRPQPGMRKADPETARRVLEEVLQDDPRQAVRHAGVRRIARACLSQSPEFASRVIEQHRDEFGRMLAGFVSEERQGGRKRDDAARDEVLGELERLAARGIIERPVRLPPPPLARKAGLAPPRLDPVRPRGSSPSAPVPRAPTELGMSPGAPRPSTQVLKAGAADQAARPTAQQPGTRRSQPAKEHPLRRPSIIRPSPMKGPRRP